MVEQVIGRAWKSREHLPRTGQVELGQSWEKDEADLLSYWAVRQGEAPPQGRDTAGGRCSLVMLQAGCGRDSRILDAFCIGRDLLAQGEGHDFDT